MTEEQYNNLLKEIDEQIEIEDSLIKKKKKEVESEPVYKRIPRYAAQTARHVVSSVGNVIDLPILPLELARYGTEYLRGRDPSFGDWMPGTAEKIKHKIDTATKGYTKPRTPAEEYWEMIAESIGTLPAGGAIGAGLKAFPKLAKVGETISKMHAPTAANIGATIGAPIAVKRYQEAFPDGSPIGSLIAGTAGAIAGGGAGAVSQGAARGALSASKDITAKAMGNLTKFSPERYEQWQKLGIPSSLGSASEHNWPTGIEIILSKLPWTEKYTAPALKERIQKIAKAAGIEQPDLSVAVDNPKQYLAKEGARKYKEAKSAEYEAHEAGWGELEKELTRKQTTTNVSDIFKKIEDNYKLGATKESDLDIFKKSFPGKVYEKLEKSVRDFSPAGASSETKIIKELIKKGVSKEAAEKFVAEQTVNPKNLASLFAVKNLKAQALGKSKDKALSEGSRREATDIHNMLRDKMVEVMETHGTPEQVKGALEAKKIWADYKSEKQSDMARHVEGLLEKRSDAEAFDLLGGRNEKYLEAASKYLDPQDKAHLAESMMASIGKQDGKWSPVKAFSRFDQFSPNVKKGFLELFKTDQQRENFLNVKKLVENNKERIQSIANTSGTAYTSAVLGMGEKISKNATKVALGAAGAGVATAMAGLEGLSTVLVGYILSKGSAKLATDPLFLERVNRVIKAQTPRAKANNILLLLKTPSVKLLKRVDKRPLIQGEERED